MPAIQQMSPEFWKRLRAVAANINARPEDLILVISSETSGTLDPKSTAWARPAQKPSPDAKWDGIYGAGLGLTTMISSVAKEMGLTPLEWWSIPDLSPEDALVYVERYFRYLLDKVAARTGKKGFDNAVDLYLANAASGLWANWPLSPTTHVYDGALWASNKALDNIGIADLRGVVGKPGRDLGTFDPAFGRKLKGWVDVLDMNNAVLSAYNAAGGRYLKQYNDYLVSQGESGISADYSPTGAPLQLVASADTPGEGDVLVPASYGKPGVSYIAIDPTEAQAATDRTNRTYDPYRVLGSGPSWVQGLAALAALAGLAYAYQESRR